MIIKALATGVSHLLLPLTLLAGATNFVPSAIAQQTQQTRLYNPIPLPPSNQVSDTLSERDIPTGDGGFARDYLVRFNQGDNIAIDLTSDHFDTIVTLMSPEGATLAENDDGPDGTTNSLLFTRINQTGNYIIRVRSFGETGGGAFVLRVTRLRPI
ncbi:PPC domain-containing protein [Chroococcidiopsis sp. TS-821]|uniref:PPC domain-containing protein n=1 Tax=Chroococcidiopsis sp. TS-821 TaxID=1378066 RepID=UPI000CEE9033|nr:PPC domain-containing protein [Chroococcidiopsis sp. TS-821]PPS44317.1 pre-peptidase [Chroococcidiopsis sp. TS-821]